MIYRKATVAIPDANYLSSRAQNRGFCAFLGFGTLIFGLFEHKIEVFVSECAIFPRFWAVLTQNRDFCALLPASFFPMGDKAAAWPGNSCRMANDATRGVGNSSAQTVGAHAPRGGH